MAKLPPITFLDSFPDTQYVKKSRKKNQLYLHHTAGSADPHSAVNWWASTKERVGTALIVAGIGHSKATWKEGQIFQCFSTEYSAWHLGGATALRNSRGSFKGKSADALNLDSIGIEICNWGWLTKKNGKYYTYVNSIVPAKDVVTLDKPYRGYLHWQRYTDAQLDSTRKLIEYLCDKWEIPTQFLGMHLFDICEEAFLGRPGVYLHTSVRKDKTDLSPQPELIAMLNSL